jgi:predicted ferric reductase
VGCLALAGGVTAGFTLGAILFLLVLLMSASLHADGYQGAKLASLVVIAVVILCIAFAILSRKKRNLALQIFLVTTFLTCLGIFSPCSSLFWYQYNAPKTLHPTVR